MIKSLLSIALSIFISLFLFTLLPTKAFAAWSCKITNKPALTTDSYVFPAGLIIDTDGNAAVGAEYGVSLDHLNDPNGHSRIYNLDNNEYFTAETAGDKIIININKAFDGIGLVGQTVNNRFKEGTYAFNLFEKGHNSFGDLCEANSNMQIPVAKASGNSSDKCVATITSNSPDGKVYPDSAVTFKADFTPPSAGEGDGHGHTVRVYDVNNNNIHDWGYPLFCNLTNACTGFTTAELANGVNISVKDDKSAFEGYPTGNDYRVVVDDNSCSHTFNSNSHDSGGGTISGTCSYCPIQTYISGGDDGDPTTTDAPLICKSNGTTDVSPFTCDLTTDKPNCSPILGCQKFTGINGAPGDPYTRTDVCPPGVNTSSGTCPKIPSGLGVDLFTDMPGLIQALLGVMLSVVGGIAILLIIVSGYRLMVAQGNPEKIQPAREQLTAAIVGLLFIIFSLVIIQVIGYDILHIPGFGE